MSELLRFERALWKQGLSRVAGVDEAGMGPLAGPVVAAAVVLPASLVLEGIRDSKKLSAGRRETLAEVIYHRALGVGIGVAEVPEIDQLNIYHAGLLAMERAVRKLPESPEYVLADARSIPGLSGPQRGIIRGDNRSQSIAAASIIAKVFRDRLMTAYDRLYPEYGFGKHKGYPTQEHRRALAAHGPCAIHRNSFTSVTEFAGQGHSEFYRLQSAFEAAASASECRRLELELFNALPGLSAYEHRKLKRLLRRARDRAESACRGREGNGTRKLPLVTTVSARRED